MIGPRRGAPFARKRFGQHFLTDPAILGRIADALGAADGDTIVEIGPGRGALTAELAARVGPRGRVVAVEIDRDLAAALRERYAARRDVVVVEGDVLEADLGRLAQAPFLLAGNIPYNITTPIVFKALEAPRATRMVFLVQREVAERLAARPGTRAYGALSVNVQAVAGVEVMFRVAAGSFSPPPRVDSAVVRLVPSACAVVTPAEETSFRSLVQSLFSFRRKQMTRALREARGLGAEAAAAVLARAGIPPAARPETLTPEDFARLTRALG